MALKPGPTGQFYLGKPINERDRGGTFVEMKSVRIQGVQAVAIEFGGTVGWLASPPTGALMIAKQCRHLINQWFGYLEYEGTTSPITVIANHEQGIVESVLPREVEVLVVNPEMILAWADGMAAAALEVIEGELPAG